MNCLYFLLLAIIVLMLGDKDKHYSITSILISLLEVIIAMIFFITKS